jgi:hypothetical protein
MHPTECQICGAPGRLILQLDSSEWNGGSPRWRPAEDSDLDGDAYWEALEPTRLTIGRYSHGGFFGCTADPWHPVVFHSQ